MNIKKIAEKANVSNATVSRVINNSPGVKDETRKRIEKIIKEENYIPNSFARSLVNKKSYVIGVLVYHIKQPFWIGIIEGVFEAAYDTEYSLFILNSIKNEDTIDYGKNYKKNLYKLIQQRVDGVIIALANKLDDEDIALLQGASMPFVVIQSDKEEKNVSAVNVDNIKGAYDLTKYLIERGHTQIIHFAGGPNSEITNDRAEGFIRAMSESGLETNANCIVNSGSRFKDGYWSMKQAYERKLPMTAIVAYNDAVAYGVYHAAQEIGLNVPDDISIAGFDRIADEIDYYKLLPNLTTMSQPMKKIGIAAFEIVLKLMNSDDEKPMYANFKLDMYEGSTCKKTVSKCKIEFKKG